MDDWRAWLPEEKSTVFQCHVRQLETCYAMFSVSLNEAMELWHAGRLPKSCQAVAIASELCTLLTEPLGAMLCSLCEHAKHYGVVPNAAPLDPAHFKGTKSQRLAWLDDLLSRVLLTQRAQFFHKISTLQDMLEDLSKDFRGAAVDLATGISEESETRWATVEADHYDINTCLREAIVLLKSFLRALPDDQLIVFEKTLGSRMSLPKSISLAWDPPPRGRMASIGRE
jgi:hypothetical protein